MFDIKNIYEAYTIDEARKALERNHNLKIIAGGTDLLVKIREGALSDIEILSIQLIKDLKKIELLDDETIRIGALCTFSEISENEIINERIPLLAQAVSTAGGPQLRNVATIGGNVCNAAPSADSAPSLFTFDTIVEIATKDGYRFTPITDFYVGLGEVNLKPDEFVTAFRIPKANYEGYIGYYYKYAIRNAMDIALSSCAVNVKLNDDRKIENIKACYGVASTVPLRAYKAEDLFRGKVLDEGNIKAFAKKALEELSPRDSWRASKEVRTQVLYEICVRSLTYCLEVKEGVYDAQ